MDSRKDVLSNSVSLGPDNGPCIHCDFAMTTKKGIKYKGINQSQVKQATERIIDNSVTYVRIHYD